MTREEAIQYLISPVATSTAIGEEKLKEFEAYNMAIRALKDRPQGEWIHDGQNFKGGLDWCHCSVCGQKTSTNGLSMYNFCPNCGAIMKGGDDE